MDAIGYVSAVATPEIMEAKRDTAIAMRSDLSYFFGEGVGADSLQINPVQYPDRKVVEMWPPTCQLRQPHRTGFVMWSRVKGDNLMGKSHLPIFSVFGIVCLAGIRQDNSVILAETTPSPNTAETR